MDTVIPLPSVCHSDATARIVKDLALRAEQRQSALLENLDRLPPLCTKQGGGPHSPSPLKPLIQSSSQPPHVNPLKPRDPSLVTLRRLYRSVIMQKEADKEVNRRTKEDHDNVHRMRVERSLMTMDETVDKWRVSLAKKGKFAPPPVKKPSLSRLGAFLPPFVGPPGMQGESDDEDDTDEKAALRRRNRLAHEGAIAQRWVLPRGRTLDGMAYPDNGSERLHVLKGKRVLDQLERRVVGDAVWIRVVSEDGRSMWVRTTRTTLGFKQYTLTPMWRVEPGSVDGVTVGPQHPSAYTFLMSSLAGSDKKTKKYLRGLERPVAGLQHQDLDTRQVYVLRKLATMAAWPESNKDKIAKLCINGAAIS